MFVLKPKWLPCVNLCHYRALSYRAYLYLLTLKSQFLITKFTNLLSVHLICLTIYNVFI
jgi:hypothetical protein